HDALPLWPARVGHLSSRSTARSRYWGCAVAVVVCSTRSSVACGPLDPALAASGGARCILGREENGLTQWTGGPGHVELTRDRAAGGLPSELAWPCGSELWFTAYTVATGVPDPQSRCGPGATEAFLPLLAGFGRITGEDEPPSRTPSPAQGPSGSRSVPADR